MASIDLTDNVDVTTQLLLQPWLWRVRAVEDLEISSADRCSRRRSLQCAPLRAVIEDVTPLTADIDSAFVVLHVASVPRGPLLDFNVSGPGGGAAFLLPRKEIASRQLAYLEALLAQSHVAVEDEARHVLLAVLAWTQDAQWQGDEPRDGVGKYLSDGLGISIAEGELADLRALNADCALMLAPYRDEPGFNIVMAPVYALPAAAAAAGVTGLAEARALLSAYRDLVGHVVQVDGAGLAVHDFLNSLVDYGHSYDMFVATEVPLDRPFLLKYEESRPIRLGLSGRGHQDVVLADAISNHVALRVTDPNVRIPDLAAVHPLTGADSYGLFSAASQTSVWSFYAHGDDRDFRARLNVKLSALWRLVAVNYFAFVIIVGLTIVLLHEHPENRDLALLTGPTALAATVLLAREPSTLGSRLRRVPTALLVAALTSMVLVSACLYIGHLSWTDAAWGHVRDFARDCRSPRLPCF